MSERDRLFHPVTGCLAGVFLLLTGPALLGAKQQEADQRSRQPQAQIEQTIDPAAPVYTERDQRTADERDEADVRAQERMADAADAAVNLSFFALLGLGGTIFFAALAWWEARKSAKADNKALRIAKTQIKEARAANKETQRISRAQSCAYVHVSEAWIERNAGSWWGRLIDEDMEEGELVPILYLRFANVGNTPTKEVTYYATAAAESGFLPFTNTGIRPDGFRHIGNIAPNDDIAPVVAADGLAAAIREARRPLPVTGSGLFGRTPRHATLTIRGRVVYRDAFDKERFSDFGFSARFLPPEGRIDFGGIPAKFDLYEPTEKLTPVGPPARQPPVPKTSKN